tara:strand:- start:1328 stop:1705 length:378 start_codon:yes stop_codon:yes gene_type:complete
MHETISKFVNANIHWLNFVQASHWQTKSFAEHEALGEHYTKFNELNDRFVETYQGNSARISFNSEMVPNVANYVDPESDEFVQRITETKDRIEKLSNELNSIDLLSILEDMLEAVSQLKYHLTLK